MKFTGEFFIPYDAKEENSNNPELETEHKQRYLSILQMVEGKTVLDIACGEGYGTSILSSRARQVFGVDINPDLVEHASRKYNQENISFLHGSASQIPLASNSVDIIVSFETLEHIDADTQNLFLAEVKRVLRINGVFIISTPNKKNYTDRYNHRNEFHLCELYEDEFEKLLKRHFGHVRLYGQGQEVASVILNKEDYLSQKPVAVIQVNHAYHFEGKYLIGLCSDLSETIQTSIASIVPESEKSYFQLVDRIIDLQREVEELGAWGKRLSGEVETLLQENAATKVLLQESGATKVLLEESVSMRTALQERSAALELAMEALALEKSALIASLEHLTEDIHFYKDIYRRSQEDLARSNNSAFLLEAELEVIQKNNTPKNGYSFDMDKFTNEVTRLSEVLSGKIHKTVPPPVPEKSKKSPMEISPIQNHDAEQKITQLQKDLLWYRKTYEERSLLGVLKQKIAAKFHK